jgi:nucleotide sugar dehydrogenase
MLEMPVQRQTRPRPAPRSEAFTHDVAVVGMGYVGLPTALGLHEAGLDVIGLDIDPRRLHAIRERSADQTPEERRQLDVALDCKRFALSSEIMRVAGARNVVICVPTPLDDHLLPDLRALHGACQAVVEHASPGQTIVLTSTSYVGTTRDELVGPLEERGLVVGDDVFVGFSPERIDPGSGRGAQRRVPRVYGGATPQCAQRLNVLLGCCADELHEVSSLETAEMTKLMENTFRAVNIALANELADVAGELGLDAMEVVNAAATKPYGFMPFLPGPGVGGHCIPCDPHYLLWQLRRSRSGAPLVVEAMACIARRPHQVVERIRQTLSDRGRGLSGTRVVVLGVAYKPDVQDVRESPALEVLSELQRCGAEIAYVDTHVPFVQLADGSILRSSEVEDIRADDLVLLHTRHAAQDLGGLADHPLVIDATYRATDLPLRLAL